MRTLRPTYVARRRATRGEDGSEPKGQAGTGRKGTRTHGAARATGRRQKARTDVRAHKHNRTTTAPPSNTGAQARNRGGGTAQGPWGLNPRARQDNEHGHEAPRRWGSQEHIGSGHQPSSGVFRMAAGASRTSSALGCVRPSCVRSGVASRVLAALLSCSS